MGTHTHVLKLIRHFHMGSIDDAFLFWEIEQLRGNVSMTGCGLEPFGLQGLARGAMARKRSGSEVLGLTGLWLGVLAQQA